jgi:CheY-specific phosphatase CheX
VTESAVLQALRDSVREVLEKMFFAETLGELPCEEPGADEIVVEIGFQGEPSGSLLLRLSSAAARQTAADFLGMDECRMSEIQITDVVRELANMICGSVLSRVESSATFRLAEPRIAPPPAEIVQCLSNTRYCVQLSNGRLTVNFGSGMLPCHQPALSAY